GAGVRRVPDVAVTGVDRDVVDAAAAGEEHQVATADVAAVPDPLDVAHLRGRRVRQRLADPGVDPAGQAGAVEAVRPGGAVLVGRALAGACPVGSGVGPSGRDEGGRLRRAGTHRGDGE